MKCQPVRSLRRRRNSSNTSDQARACRSALSVSTPSRSKRQAFAPAGRPSMCAVTGTGDSHGSGRIPAARARPTSRFAVCTRSWPSSRRMGSRSAADKVPAAACKARSSASSARSQHDATVSSSYRSTARAREGSTPTEPRRRPRLPDVTASGIEAERVITGSLSLDWRSRIRICGSERCGELLRRPVHDGPPGLRPTPALAFSGSMVIAGLLIGLVVGAGAAWLYARAQSGAQRAALMSEAAALGVELEHERARSAKKVALLEQTERDFSSRFDALAADALRKNNESFLELAAAKLGQKAVSYTHLT